MKQTIRLTESELRGMIQETVKEALNEIGDTHRGQFMLGRVYSKNNEKYDDPSASKLANYAFDKKIDKNNFNSDWDNGVKHQRNMTDATNYPYGFKRGRAMKNMKFDYDVAAMQDSDEQRSNFINWLLTDRSNPLQDAVGYLKGYEPYGFDNIINMYEDAIGYELSPKNIDNLETALNIWWHYNESEFENY